MSKYTTFTPDEAKCHAEAMRIAYVHSLVGGLISRSDKEIEELQTPFRMTGQSADFVAALELAKSLRDKGPWSAERLEAHLRAIAEEHMRDIWAAYRAGLEGN